jgi:hypothetical protein
MVTQKPPPAGPPILLLTLGHPQSLPIAIDSDADGDQHRDVNTSPAQLRLRITPSTYRYGNSPTIWRLRQASMWA